MEEATDKIIGYGPMSWAEDEYGWHVQFSKKPEDGKPITIKDVFNFMHGQTEE